MNRKNVLFVVNGLAIGGGELKVLDLVRGLLKWYSHEFNPVVCSVGQGGPLFERFTDIGIEPAVYEKRCAFDVSLIRKTARLMKERETDIVQTTLFYADVIGAAAARLAGVGPVISWEAVTQLYGKKHLLAYKIASRLYTKSVAVSHAIEHKVQECYGVPPEKTMTIHYGVELERFSNQRTPALKHELGLPADAVVYGTVARFTDQKGHVYLVEAAREIVKQKPDSHFVLAGDGPLRQMLEKKIHHAGLDDHFHLLGFRTDVEEVLKGFDVFVLPSLYEGLPNVVLEAMAGGLPVIATAVDGTPEAVVHNSTGLLIPPRDPGAIADAAKVLGRNQSLRREMGDRGRKRVEQEFSWRGEVEQFVKLYRSLV